MITRNEYIEWYEKEKKNMLDSGRYKCKPRFLFSRTIHNDWVFAKFNFNGGDILRKFLSDSFEKIEKTESFEIKRYYHNGYTTIFFFASQYWYEIKWHKNYERTESIKMNGEPIHIDDYINWCNLLNISLE